MLILTRKIGETVIIGGEVSVTILGLHGQQVRVGIDAPHEIPIHRQEVHERIEAERAKATA